MDPANLTTEFHDKSMAFAQDTFAALEKTGFPFFEVSWFIYYTTSEPSGNGGPKPKYSFLFLLICWSAIKDNMKHCCKLIAETVL